MVLFRILAFVVFLSLHLFCSGTIFYFFPNKITRIFFWALPILGPLAILLSFSLNRKTEGDLSGLITLFGHYWTGIIFLLFMVCVAMIVANLLFTIIRIDIKPYIGLVGVCFFVLASLAAIISGQQQPVMREIVIKDPSLPVERLSVVQISDTHLGTGVPLKKVRKMVQDINALNPNLILVTGDFFENGGKVAPKNAAILKEMKANYGKFGTLGNHEFYRGLDKSIKFYEDAGITLLRQQTEEPAKNILVSGLDDFSTANITQKDFRDFLEALPENKYKIIMAHEPKYFGTAAGRANLMLCGHTHNGQIYPFNYLVRLRYKHVYGQYKQNKTNFYVTSGAFYWGPPMRLFSRNEIPFIIIER